MGRPPRRKEKFFLTVKENCSLWVKCISWFHGDDDRLIIDIPYLNPYETWITDTLQNMGFSNGEKPIPFTEMRAWSGESKIDLTLWEMETLKRLSNEYVVGYNEQKKTGTLPPYASEERLNKLKIAYAENRKHQLKQMQKEKRRKKKKKRNA